MSEEMNSILARLEALEKKSAVLEAKSEIEALMSRHQFLMAAGLGEQVVSDLWTLDDESSVEYSASGLYKEPLNVKSFYYDRRMAGRLSVFALTSGRVRLAEDGKTACGFWIALGAESDAGDLGPNPPADNEQRKYLLTSVDENGNRYKAEWLWQQYGAEFVLTEDGWKLHKLHIAEFFRCPFDQDWVKFASRRWETDGMWLENEFDAKLDFPHGEHMPSKPSTFHWQYTTDSIPEILPESTR